MRIALIAALLALPLAADTSGRRGRTGPVVVLYFGANAAAGSHQRLVDIGATVQRIDASDLPKALENADILYLPTEWATGPTRDALRTHKAAIEAWLRRGRGIYVSQANIDGEITELPLRFTVANFYNAADRTTPEGESPFLKGLEDKELPWPCDRITAHDAAFRVHAKGSVSGTPALMTAQWQGGRIVVNLDNDNVRAVGGSFVGPSTTSDACLQRLLEWLAKRPIRAR